MEDDGLLRVVMGNSHLYSHPWWRTTVVRLIRETREEDTRHCRDSLMAHGIESSLNWLPGQVP
jgi:hypothetical protein